MSATAREVLAPDSGRQLPAAVRRKLVGLGIATNHAATAVAQAELLQMQCLAIEEGEQALQNADSHVTETAAMLGLCALQYQEQLMMGYAVVAAQYAVYVSQVAADMTTGERITDVSVSGVLPSQLIRDLDQRLPHVRFPTGPHSTTVVQERNAGIEAARVQLVTVIQRQLRGSAATEYDSMETAPRPKSSHDLVVDFPVALHNYAATVTWAVGMFANPAPAAPR